MIGLINTSTHKRYMYISYIVKDHEFDFFAHASIILLRKFTPPFMSKSVFSFSEFICLLKLPTSSFQNKSKKYSHPKFVTFCFT